MHGECRNLTLQLIVDLSLLFFKLFSAEDIHAALHIGLHSNNSLFIHFRGHMQADAPKNLKLTWKCAAFF